jgi:hypothetical protein
MPISLPIRYWLGRLFSQIDGPFLGLVGLLLLHRG